MEILGNFFPCLEFYAVHTEHLCTLVYAFEHSGSFVPETLVAALDELEREYAKCKEDPEFIREVVRGF